MSRLPMGISPLISSCPSTPQLCPVHCWLHVDHCGGGAGQGGEAPPQEATVRASGASTPSSSGEVVSGVGARDHEPPEQYYRQVRTGVHFQVEELAYHS